MAIYFMHITKTAGGSVKEALRRSSSRVAFHYPHESGFRADFGYPPETEVIFGHYVFGAHVAAAKPGRYAGFLREPISRTISHYHHLKNNDRGPVGDRLRQFPTMADYLTKARHWEFDNFQCRLISGAANKPAHGNIGYNTYVSARENLARYFEFIGIFERMGESVEKLKALVSTIDADLPTVNKGTYGSEVNEDEWRLVESLNRYDQLLYQDALRLFEIRKAS